MNRAFTTVASCLLIGVTVHAPSRAETPATSPAAIGLLERMIAAINSKNRTQMLEFAKNDGDSSTPAEQRTERMSSFAERGAPLTIEKVESSDGNDIRGVVVDREGLRLQFVLHVVGLPPALKLASFQVRPVEDSNESPPKDYSGWTSLAGLAAAVRADSHTPAIGLALYHDGKLSVATDGVRALGKPDQVGADEPWSIGSIGKPLCSTVIAKLIEAGQLDFGTTLKAALPGVPMKPEYEAVTLEQVMQHRAGLPEDPGMRKPQVDAIVAGETDPTKMRGRYARDILSRAPIAKPGERFGYSNAGYALLAYIAELKTGKSYEQLLRDLVFTPLGLTHSYAGSATYPPQLPQGHISGPQGLQPVDFRGPLEVLFAGAGGGIYMSPADLARFGAAHLAGLRGQDGYLKAKTIARLHQGKAEGDGSDSAYACGWGIHTSPGVEPWHGHNGSNGTFRAELAIFPQAGLVAVAMVNAGGESEPSPPLQAVLAMARRFAKVPER